MSSASPPPIPDPESGRLDSWKQIAAYLDKSERTVRRWQQTEGLPVYKHQHQAKGSVWAYTAEIDHWLAARRVSPEPLVEEPAVLEPAPTAHSRTPMLLAAVLAVGTVALAGLFWSNRTSTVAAPFLADPEPLTALPGSAYGPTISPDGRQVAFFWQSNAKTSGLYVKAIGSERVTPILLAQPGEYLYSPAWSPDGKTIAYLQRTFPGSRFAEHNTQSETWLYLVAAAGGPPRPLIRLAEGVLFYGNHKHLDWSRDSQRVLAPMADGVHRGVHWIPVNGGEPRQLTHPEAEHHHAPVLSPDGRALVYMKQTGPDQAAVESVYRLDLTAQGEPAGDPVVLSESRSMTSGIAWTPSGKDLIVCRADSALVGSFNSRLYRLPADGTDAAVPLGSGQCNTVTTLRQGGTALLAYASGDNTRCRLWQANLDQVEAAKPFAPSSRFDALPAYSPNGAFVSFVSNRSGKPEVWIAKRDGTEAKKLTTGSHVASTPQWSPNGGRLVYGAAVPVEAQRKLSAHGLYTVPVAGGEPERVPLGRQAAGDPTWTVDGSMVQFWSGRQLWRVRPDGSHPAKLGEFPVHFLKSNVPGGRSLLYARSAAPFEIRLAAMEGAGEDRVLAEGVLSPSFAVTAKFVYFVRRADQSLYAQPLAGGPARRLGRVTLIGRLILGMTVSPDDRSIVWANTEVPQSDLMLVRDFR